MQLTKITPDVFGYIIWCLPPEDVAQLLAVCRIFKVAYHEVAISYVQHVRRAFSVKLDNMPAALSTRQQLLYMYAQSKRAMRTPKNAPISAPLPLHMLSPCELPDPVGMHLADMRSPVLSPVMSP